MSYSREEEEEPRERARERVHERVNDSPRGAPLAIVSIYTYFRPSLTHAFGIYLHIYIQTLGRAAAEGFNDLAPRITLTCDTYTLYSSDSRLLLPISISRITNRRPPRARDDDIARG